MSEPVYFVHAGCPVFVGKKGTKYIVDRTYVRYNDKKFVVSEWGPSYPDLFVRVKGYSVAGRGRCFLVVTSEREIQAILINAHGYTLYRSSDLCPLMCCREDDYCTDRLEKLKLSGLVLHDLRLFEGRIIGSASSSNDYCLSDEKGVIDVSVVSFLEELRRLYENDS